MTPDFSPVLVRASNMSHHHFPSFEPEGERKWSIYYQRFLAHCSSKKLVTDEDRKSEFIACSSDDMFEWTEGLCQKSLADPALTFVNIATAIENHVKPPECEILAAAHFHSRNQQAGESVKDFVAELRRLARPCNFGNAYDRTLRDRIVLGIASTETRALLFKMSKEDCTVDKVVTLARSVEAAQHQALSTLPSSAATTPVHYMGRAPSAAPSHGAASRSGQSRHAAHPQPQQPTRQPSSATCRRCDGPHASDKCKYDASILCDYCNNSGHVPGVLSAEARRARSQASTTAAVRDAQRRTQPEARRTRAPARAGREHALHQGGAGRGTRTRGSFLRAGVQ